MADMEKNLQSAHEVEEYYQQLEVASKKIPQDMLMRIKWVNMMIDRIETAKKIIKNESYDSLHPKVKETLKSYSVSEVANSDDPEGTKKKLFVLKENSRSLEVVPLMSTYPTMRKAHILTKHGGVTEMNDWLSQSNLAVASICAETILKICKTCPNKLETHEINKEEYKAVGQLGILDMSKYVNKENLDNLLIYQDMDTKFLLLRPVSSLELEASVTMELAYLFSDMGLPECLILPSEDHCNEMFIEALGKLNEMFSSPIKLMKEMSQANMCSLVEETMKDWLSKAANRIWCIGCFIVQWNLNNTPGTDGKTPFEKMIRNKNYDTNIDQSMEDMNLNLSCEKNI